MSNEQKPTPETIISEVKDALEKSIPGLTHPVMPARADYKPTYWEIKKDNIIVKRISDTQVYQVQVKGRDMASDFHHSHERTTFPSKERLDEHLQSFTPSTEEEYDILLAAHFQITAGKRNWYNEYKQRKYDLQVQKQYPFPRPQDTGGLNG